MTGEDAWYQETHHPPAIALGTAVVLPGGAVATDGNGGRKVPTTTG